MNADRTTPKLLMVTDSPVIGGMDNSTGYARVAQNLLRRWKGHFERIDLWAIGYNGVPCLAGRDDNEFLHPPFRLYATEFPLGGPWHSKFHLQNLAQHVFDSDYTHVFFLQDVFWFADPAWVGMFVTACEERWGRNPHPDPLPSDGRGRDDVRLLRNGIKIFFYAPVDGPLDPAWVRFLEEVEGVVAITEFGKAEICKHSAILSKAGEQRTTNRRVCVLPHGVDTGVYRITGDRVKWRREHILVGERQWLQDGDVALLSVAQHQPRKDVARTLQLLRALKDMEQSAHAAQVALPHRQVACATGTFKLIMHMTAQAVGQDNSHLDLVAQQLGLRYGHDYIHTDHLFHRDRALQNEETVNAFYNLADLYVSTSLGEGWGLCTTEALAAGCPVAIPDHTAGREIMDHAEALGMADRVLRLPLSPDAVVLPRQASRLRYPVDVRAAAAMIYKAWQSGQLAVDQRRPLTKEFRKWLSWDRIAAEFLNLMLTTPKRDDRKRRAEVLEHWRKAPGIVEQAKRWEALTPTLSRRTGEGETESALSHSAGFFKVPLEHGDIHLNCGMVERGERSESNIEHPTSNIQHPMDAGRVLKEQFLATRWMRNGTNGIAIWKMDEGKAESGNQKIEISVVGPPVAEIFAEKGEFNIEDPRIIWDEHRQRYWLGVNQFHRAEEKYLKHQVLYELNADFEPVGEHHIEYGGNRADLPAGPVRSWGNTGHECNWTYFLHEGEPVSGRLPETPARLAGLPDLMLLYMISPHTVVRLGGAALGPSPRPSPAPAGEGVIIAVETFRTDPDLPWEFGFPSGGTPPVRGPVSCGSHCPTGGSPVLPDPIPVSCGSHCPTGGPPVLPESDEYFVFFHSRLEKVNPKWPKHQYVMGAYAFEAQPPFRITRMTRQPLLAGSQADPRMPWSPLVVFPCGAVILGSGGSGPGDGGTFPQTPDAIPKTPTWLVTLGVNDCACAWVRIPHDWLLSKMEVVP